jgi:hypothetical protein
LNDSGRDYIPPWDLTRSHVAGMSVENRFWLLAQYQAHLSDGEALRSSHAEGLVRSQLQQAISLLQQAEKIAVGPLEAKQLGHDQGADPVAEERQSLLKAFKATGKKQGIPITDKMVAKAAKSEWNDRTMVTWWKRNDPKCRPLQDRLIRTVLRKNPSAIWPK